MTAHTPETLAALLAAEAAIIAKIKEQGELTASARGADEVERRYLIRVARAEALCAAVACVQVAMERIVAPDPLVAAPTLATELSAALVREKALREALREEREDNLWAVYEGGHESDGDWFHMFMSSGEWLARELGLDPTLGRYDAATIKAAIPGAAARYAAALAQEVQG